MELIEDLLWVPSHLISSRTFFTIDCLHVYQQIVELNLSLCHLLFRSTHSRVFIDLLIKHSIIVSIILVSFLACILSIIKSFFVFLSIIDLINKLLVRFIHVPQFSFQLIDKRVSLVITNLASQAF